ncbi:MAG: phage tail sheath family protein [Ardenticatenaceae bacterium]|nr:phage tail sheath family protein [Ardenticatenaceae bacterium]
MTTLTRPLPGIRFQTVVPSPPEVLPRMDIAAFVGLAARGPLNLPVAVEEIGRFRDIFGPDLPLAWDSKLGQMQTAHLGPAVEAFFRNGGQRCWVVRVAAAGKRAAWYLPGLFQADTLAPASIAARCPGSWADDLRVGTVLHSETVSITFDEPGSLPETAVSFRLRGERVQIGDLLRVDFDEVQLFLAITAVETQAAQQQATAQPYWIEKTAVGSPLPLPTTATAALRLTFDLYVWYNEQLIGHLPKLGFHRDHPRSYHKLPTDATLFARHDDNGNPRLFTDFEQEAARQPRFPLAFTGGDGSWTLPLGMADLPDSDRSVLPHTDRDPKRKLHRDGLDKFGVNLFLDPNLGTVGSRALPSAANDKFYLSGEALTGIHAVWPLEEVTLIAVPDAVQPGWDFMPAEQVQPLAAPHLITVSEVAGGVEIEWTAVSEATTYRLAWSREPDFAAAEVIETANTTITLPLPSDCPTHFYYRVHAQRGGERSAWSNTLTLLLPQQSFMACPEQQPPPLELSLYETETDLHFAWSASPPAAASYVWQWAGEPDFGAGVKTAVLSHPAHTIPKPAALSYFRVRQQPDGTWSNTVSYVPPPPSAWRLNDPAPDDEATTLLTVQQALLHLCAARADLFAILSLPANSRRPVAERHAAEQHQQRLLTSVGGESNILSYGALYHPWLIQPQGSGSSYAATPPDGTVCGLFAHRALERGAWVAPANVPLSSVVSLAPAIDSRQRPSFYDRQINLIHQGPRGFLLLSADTLSQQADLRPINVRRLLILLRRLTLREGQTYVFEPNSPAFRRLVQHRFEQLLALLYARGAFAGETADMAYQVVVDDTLNSRQSVDQGRFIVELRVAPSQPLAYITVRLVQTERAGLTVTEV